MSAGGAAASARVLSRMRWLALACVVALVGLRAWDPALLAEPRERLFDYYQEWWPPAPVSGQVVVVDIDEPSLRALGQWPWPRRMMARLIEAVAKAQPLVVGFTILFPEPDRLAPDAIVRSLPDLDPEVAAGLAKLPSGDELLARSFRKVPVVLGLATGQGEAPPALLAMSSADPAAFLEAHAEPVSNLPVLAAAARGTGVVTLGTAYDRVVRQIPGAVRIGGAVRPALAVEMARIGRGAPPLRLVGGALGLEAIALGDLLLPTDGQGAIRFADRPQNSLPRISAALVLAGAPVAQLLAGKHVLIGTSAVGLGERYATPLGTRMPALEIHAELLDALLSSQVLLRSPLAALAETGLAVVFGGLLLAMLRWRHASGGLVALGLAAALTVGCSWLAYTQAGLLLDPLFPVLAVAVMAALLVASRLAAARLAAEGALREREGHLKELQGKLLSLSRLGAMQQLSSALAHELNQPLAAIGNYVQASRKLLDSGAVGGLDRVRSHLDKAIGQVARAGAIVVGLRDIVERGETARKPEDANDTVGEAASSALVGFEPSAVRMTMDLAPGLPAVLINRIQIQQVVLNLVRNAVEAMVSGPPPGEGMRHAVGVATRLDPAGAVEVAVSDSGPGLAPEIEARLFEPFVSSKMAGMGIGLAISRSIVEAHGGRLTASRNPERGMTFRFTLPVATGPHQHGDDSKS